MCTTRICKATLILKPLEPDLSLFDWAPFRSTKGGGQDAHVAPLAEPESVCERFYV